MCLCRCLEGAEGVEEAGKATEAALEGSEARLVRRGLRGGGMGMGGSAWAVSSYRSATRARGRCGSGCGCGCGGGGSCRAASSADREGMCRGLDLPRKLAKREGAIWNFEGEGADDSKTKSVGPQMQGKVLDALESMYTVAAANNLCDGQTK